MLSYTASIFIRPTPKILGNPVNSARRPGSEDGSSAGDASKERHASAVDEVILQMPFLWTLSS